MKKRKITGYAWFTPSQTQTLIAIVITVNEVGEVKAYLGINNAVWETEKEALIYIAQNGATFPLAEAESIIKNSGRKKTIEIPI